MMPVRSAIVAYGRGHRSGAGRRAEAHRVFRDYGWPHGRHGCCAGRSSGGKGAQIGILADAAIADEGARLVGELAVPFSRPARGNGAPLKPFDVAIVGMGCLLPKAPNVRAFWANILNKVDAISDIPKERFNIDLYYDPDRKAKDKMHSRWGGFLDPGAFRSHALRHSARRAALHRSDAIAGAGHGGSGAARCRLSRSRISAPERPP